MDSSDPRQPGDQHPVPSLEIKRRTGEHQHWKGEDKCAMLPGIEPGPAAMGQELAQSRITGQQPAPEKQKDPRHEHGNESDKPGRGRHRKDLTSAAVVLVASPWGQTVEGPLATERIREGIRSNWNSSYATHQRCRATVCKHRILWLVVRYPRRGCENGRAGRDGQGGQ